MQFLPLSPNPYIQIRISTSTIEDLNMDLELSFKSIGYGNNLGVFNEFGCEYLEDIMS